MYLPCKEKHSLLALRNPRKQFSSMLGANLNSENTHKKHKCTKMHH